MTDRPRKRFRLAEERGFTLIELLVVMLILGLLASIAVPAFFSQRDKGSDTDAISNVRNLRTKIAGCYLETNDYGQCQSSIQLKAADMPFGTGAGQVYVLPNPLGSGGTAAVGISSTGTSFVIYSLGGIDERVCIPASGSSIPKGSCKSGGIFAAYGYGTW